MVKITITQPSNNKPTCCCKTSFMDQRNNEQNPRHAMKQSYTRSILKIKKISSECLMLAPVGCLSLLRTFGIDKARRGLAKTNTFRSWSAFNWRAVPNALADSWDTAPSRQPYATVFQLQLRYAPNCSLRKQALRFLEPQTRKNHLT